MLSRFLSARVMMVSGASALALALGTAHAQEDQTQGQQTQGQQTQGQQTQGQQDQGQQDQDQQDQNQPQGEAATQQAEEEDVLIATVGATDLRASDVLAAIEQMPPGMRQQPQEMLVPMALEQAILRELILQQAMAENLAEDPDVVALVQDASQIAEEDAMVSVWLQRAMEDRVSDERVQEVYDQLEAEAEQELPPLEAIRPQIEQQLGREAIEGIRAELRDNISVVYYGPDGEPVETTADVEPGTAPEDQDGETDGGTNGGAGD